MSLPGPGPDDRQDARTQTPGPEPGKRERENHDQPRRGRPGCDRGPRQLLLPLDRAPGDAEFIIPDCSDPRAITTYALHRLNLIIAAYQAFLDKVRGHDDVSFALLVGLLAAETHRRADVQAALARTTSIP